MDKPFVAIIIGKDGESYIYGGIEGDSYVMARVAVPFRKEKGDTTGIACLGPFSSESVAQRTANMLNAVAGTMLAEDGVMERLPPNTPEQAARND